MRKTAGQLMGEGVRYCFYVPEDALVPGEGFRPSVVFEDVSGHFPNGTWPYEGKPGQSRPWFWGFDLQQAKRICDEKNAELGITKEEATRIVASSMGARER